jgi:hypothetical protein
MTLRALMYDCHSYNHYKFSEVDVDVNPERARFSAWYSRVYKGSESFYKMRIEEEEEASG